jgi:hypothetical protein
VPGKLGLVYTFHAREQMADRAVTEADVELVLTGFDMSRPDSRGNMRLAGEIAPNSRLLIVVAKDSEPPRIISIWRTGRRRRV